MTFRPGEHPRDPQGRFRDKEALRKQRIIPQTVCTYEPWKGHAVHEIAGWGTVKDPNTPRSRENAEITERMEDFGLMPCTNNDMSRPGMYMGYMTQDDAKETVEALNEEFPDRTFETIDPDEHGELWDTFGFLEDGSGRYPSGDREPQDQDVVFALTVEGKPVEEWNDAGIENTYRNAGAIMRNTRAMGGRGNLTFVRDTTILHSNTRKVRDELIRQGYPQETADKYAEDILIEDEWNEDDLYTDRWNRKEISDGDARNAISSYDLPRVLELAERRRRMHADGKEGE